MQMPPYGISPLNLTNGKISMLPPFGFHKIPSMNETNGTISIHWPHRIPPMNNRTRMAMNGTNIAMHHPPQM